MSGNKKSAVIALIAILMLGAIVVGTNWNDIGTGVHYAETVPDDGIDFGVAEDGTLSKDSLNYVLFEEYGGLLLVLGVLMFGAMVAGVCISREEGDSDD